MSALRELLLLLRVQQCRLSVASHLRDIDSARAGLERAYLALDRAASELAIHDDLARVDHAVCVFQSRESPQ